MRTRRPGRPGKSESDDVVDAVLRATLAELREHGLHALSIDRVAARAGVAKTTVYRRWGTKWNLVLAAWMLVRARLSKPLRPTNDVAADVAHLVNAGARRIRTREGRALTQALMALDDRAAAALARRLHDTGAAPVTGRLRAARGQVRADGPADLAAELLIALVLYRQLFRKSDVSRREVAAAVDLVLHGLGPRGSKRRRR